MVATRRHATGNQPKQPARQVNSTRSSGRRTEPETVRLTSGWPSRGHAATRDRSARRRTPGTRPTNGGRSRLCRPADVRYRSPDAASSECRTRTFSTVMSISSSSPLRVPHASHRPSSSSSRSVTEPSRLTSANSAVRTAAARSKASSDCSSSPLNQSAKNWWSCAISRRQRTSKLMALSSEVELPCVFRFNDMLPRSFV